MKNGLHIDDQGTKVWYLKGKRHREDGPAVEEIDGTKIWMKNDRRHREDGPAIEWNDGTKMWYLRDELHREDGPAIEWNDGDDGSKEWYLNNKRLEVLPKYVLINYMKANNYTLAHLLTDPDPLVRESVEKHKWKEAI